MKNKSNNRFNINNFIENEVEEETKKDLYFSTDLDDDDSEINENISDNSESLFYYEKDKNIKNIKAKSFENLNQTKNIRRHKLNKIENINNESKIEKQEGIIFKILSERLMKLKDNKDPKISLENEKEIKSQSTSISLPPSENNSKNNYKDQINENKRREYFYNTSNDKKNFNKIYQNEEKNIKIKSINLNHKKNLLKDKEILVGKEKNKNTNYNLNLLDKMSSFQNSVLRGKEQKLLFNIQSNECNNKIKKKLNIASIFFKNKKNK